MSHPGYSDPTRRQGSDPGPHPSPPSGSAPPGGPPPSPRPGPGVGPVPAPPGPAPGPPLRIARALVLVLALYVLLSLLTGPTAEVVGHLVGSTLPGDSALFLVTGLLLLAGTSLQAAAWIASIVLSALVIARSRGRLRTAGIVALVVVLVGGLTTLGVSGDPTGMGGGIEAAFTVLEVIGVLLGLVEVVAGVVALVLLLRALHGLARAAPRR